MMKRIIILIAGILTLIMVRGPVLSALDPHKAISQYVFDKWEIEEGLPQSSVNAIARTSDGYLWLGTQEGLVRFDGVNLKTIDDHNSGMLSTGLWVNSLLADSHERLWIGSNGGGLARLTRGKISTWTTRDGLPSDLLTSLYEDHDGNIWIGTNGSGLCRVLETNDETNVESNDESRGESSKQNNNTGLTFQALTTEQGLSDNRVNGIYQDREGYLWIGTDRGLDRFKGGTFHDYPHRNVFSGIRVNAIFTDHLGDMWVGTVNGLYRIRGGRADSQLRRFTRKDGLSGKRIEKIAADGDHNLWVGTANGGLNRLHLGDGSNRFNYFYPRPDMPSNGIDSIYIDPEGSLWLGTEDSGLCRFKDGIFMPYSIREGLSNNMVRTVYVTPEGVIWMGTSGGGVNVLKDGKFSVIDTKKGLSGNVIRSLCLDSRGDMWVGTIDNGLNRINRDTGEITIYGSAEGLTDNRVKSLLEDRDGNIWIGTQGGLNHWKPGQDRIKAFAPYGGFENAIINCIYQDRQGNLWTGSEGMGVCLLDVESGGYKQFTTEHGLSQNMIRSIFQDSRGNLWFGTSGGGLNLKKGDTFVSVSVRDGLFNGKVMSMLEDENGLLWMTCNKGIYHASIDQLTAFFEGSVEAVKCFSYNESDGMKSRECNGSSQPAAFRGGDGRMWFPTIRGAVVVNPGAIVKNRIPPPVVIEEVVTDNQTIPVGSSESTVRVEIPAGNERLTINYTGLSFRTPDKLRFKVKLEGFDSDWKDYGSRRVAYYTKLPPGRFKFRVKACNESGVWNEEGHSFSFYKQPYFSQTWWFLISCVVFLGILSFGVYRLRVRRLTNRKRELEELVEKRTRELEKANRTKSDFLARMSHEIRTPMNGIIGFSDMLKSTKLDEAQAEYVRIISRSGEVLTTLLNDILDLAKIEAGLLIIHPVEFKPRQLMQEVVDITRPRLEEKPVEISSRVDSRVPEYLYGDDGRFRQVLMNLLGNAAKFTSEGEIRADMEILDRDGDSVKVHVIVRDTGIGIASDKLEVIFDSFQQADGSTTRRFGGTGLGLPICRQIAGLMGGRVWVESVKGEGSVFHFTAELGVTQKTGESTHQDGKDDNRDDVTAGSVHIMLVEDNPINQKLAQYILTKVGWRVTVADNGEEAVRYFSDTGDEFDLVFMDVQMPKMNGFDATRRIRSMNGSRIPIIAMTAQSMKGDREKCLEAGMDDYISKPIKRDKVIEMVRKWLPGKS